MGFSDTLVPVLTPHGRFLLAQESDAPALAPELALRLRESFARGAGYGLLGLGAVEVATVLPPVFGYWRDFAARYVTAVCARSDASEARPKIRISPPPSAELEALAAQAPPMTGAEYVTAGILGALWEEIEAAFQSEVAATKASVQEFLRSRNPAWNLVGRVHFNLAEMFGIDMAAPTVAPVKGAVTRVRPDGKK